MIAGRFVPMTGSASTTVCSIVTVLSPDVPLQSSISNPYRDFTKTKTGRVKRNGATCVTYIEEGNVTIGALTGADGHYLHLLGQYYNLLRRGLGYRLEIWYGRLIKAH